MNTKAETQSPSCSRRGSWPTTCGRWSGTASFKAEPMPWWDGIVRCEVLELDLHKRLRGWERMIGQGLIEVLAREAGGAE